MTTELQLGGEIQSFDEEKRELYVRVLPWEQDVSTPRGVERFAKGAFEGIDPGRFIVRVRHQDPPTGRGISLEEKDDALYMGLRIARTQAGDEQLTLAKDGIETGVSIGIEDGDVETKPLTSGRFHYYHKRVKEDGVLEVSTTYRPAYGQDSQVLTVLEKTEMAEATPATTEAAPVASTVTESQLEDLREFMRAQVESLRDRQTIMGLLPEGPEKAEMQRKIQLDAQLALADIITTGNEGVLPSSLSSEMLGTIDIGRPFLNGMRQVPAPAAGTRLLYPKITQRPIAAVQESEKGELASQATIITTVDYGMQTIGGAADISMQLIRRSSPEFLTLFLQLLGQAYAAESEEAGLTAFLAEAAVVEGGAFNVASPSLGGAFTNTVTATGRTMKPDRIFLSTAAVVAFMNAKEPTGGGGRPLYPGIAGIGGLQGGEGSSQEFAINLKPVWAPVLDPTSVEIVVGPSAGFVWAEDGTYTLQADVPSKFGRDVGLAGMLWFAPLYPAAFTTYTLA